MASASYQPPYGGLSEFLLRLGFCLLGSGGCFALFTFKLGLDRDQRQRLPPTPLLLLSALDRAAADQILEAGLLRLWIRRAEGEAGNVRQHRRDLSIALIELLSVSPQKLIVDHSA
jgi:hypothetical protein